MRIEELIKIVRDAGALAMDAYGKDIEVTQKSDNTPLTEADTAVHNFLIEKLENTGIPVLSEEGEQEVAPHEGKMWVIDPIDGTKDFIQHTDDFSVMVALVEDGVPVLSVVYAPALYALYYAEKGKGAYVLRGEEKEKLQVSQVCDLNDAGITVSRNHGSREWEEKLKKAGVTKVIPRGSGGVKLSLMAEGKADMYINDYRNLGWWDIAAPQLILEEAGGRVTGFYEMEDVLYNEKPYRMKGGVLATNGAVHEKVFKVMWG